MSVRFGPRRRRRQEVEATRQAQLPAGTQRRNRRALVAAAVAAIVLIGLVSAVIAAHRGPATPAAQRQAGGTSAVLAAGCRRGNPLANVYHEDRIKVRNRCLTVTGTVAAVSHEEDGDFHVNLNLPPAEAHLLNAANRAYQNGQLVTEIVPADEPGCTPGRPPLPAHGSYNYGICTGADITPPPAGARVAVTGPYVLDAFHGWMEIHPVWAVRLISGPSAPLP